MDTQIFNKVMSSIKLGGYFVGGVMLLGGVVGIGGAVTWLLSNINILQFVNNTWFVPGPLLQCMIIKSDSIRLLTPKIIFKGPLFVQFYYSFRK
jgi:hypothetical protein